PSEPRCSTSPTASPRSARRGRSRTTCPSASRSPGRDGRPSAGGERGSAYCPLDERSDRRLHLRRPRRQREGGGPHGAVVEAGLVAEAERGVARLELVRALEEDDDLAVSGVGGHP